MSHPLLSPDSVRHLCRLCAAAAARVCAGSALPPAAEPETHPLLQPALPPLPHHSGVLPFRPGWVPPSCNECGLITAQISMQPRLPGAVEWKKDGGAPNKTKRIRQSQTGSGLMEPGRMCIQAAPMRRQSSRDVAAFEGAGWALVATTGGACGVGPENKAATSVPAAQAAGVAAAHEASISREPRHACLTSVLAVLPAAREGVGRMK